MATQEHEAQAILALPRYEAVMWLAIILLFLPLMASA
jgi:hypothetical protein